MTLDCGAVGNANYKRAGLSAAPDMAEKPSISVSWRSVPARLTKPRDDGAPLSLATLSGFLGCNRTLALTLRVARAKGPLPEGGCIALYDVWRVWLYGCIGCMCCIRCIS